MMQNIFKFSHTLRSSVFAVGCTLLLSAPAHAEIAEENCVGASCSERGINAPVSGSVEIFSFVDSDAHVRANYRMPTFNTAWGLPRAMYEKAVRFWEANKSSFPNQRFVTIGDFNQHSSRKRLYIFDLGAGKVERHNFAHGAGSDSNRDGYATQFSNTEDSHMSSIGFYRTDATYIGKHGFSMRLRGLSSTNSSAYERSVVMHPADYVSDAGSRAGNSWGCPAVDPKYSKSIINRLKGGSMLLLDR
jgi:hypothetical protein